MDKTPEATSPEAAEFLKKVVRAYKIGLICTLALMAISAIVK